MKHRGCRDFSAPQQPDSSGWTIQSQFCLFRQRHKCRLVMNSKIRQHFTVQFNTGFVQSRNKTTVTDSIFSRCRIDTYNPQGTKLTFFSGVCPDKRIDPLYLLPVWQPCIADCGRHDIPWLVSVPFYGGPWQPTPLFILDIFLFLD